MGREGAYGALPSEHRRSAKCGAATMGTPHVPPSGDAPRGGIAGNG